MFQGLFCGDDNNVLSNRAIFAVVGVAVYHVGASLAGVDNPYFKSGFSGAWPLALRVVIGDAIWTVLTLTAN